MKCMGFVLFSDTKCVVQLSVSTSLCMCTDQSLVVDLLPDEFVLAEGVAGLSSDRVYWSLFHLLLHGTVQHKERLTSTLLETGKEGRRK